MDKLGSPFEIIGGSIGSKKNGANNFENDGPLIDSKDK